MNRWFNDICKDDGTIGGDGVEELSPIISSADVSFVAVHHEQMGTDRHGMTFFEQSNVVLNLVLYLTGRSREGQSATQRGIDLCAALALSPVSSY